MRESARRNAAARNTQHSSARHKPIRENIPLRANAVGKQRVTCKAINETGTNNARRENARQTLRVARDFGKTLRYRSSDWTSVTKRWC